MNRVKVTRGCAMAWRPCRVSLYVLPPFPFPLPSRLSARLLVGLSVSLRIAHCAAHCVRNFLFRVRFSSVFRCRQSVRKRRAVWSFFGCLSARSTLVLQFGSVRFDSSSSVGSPGAPFGLSNEFVCCGWKTLRTLKVSVSHMRMCIPICVCECVCSKWKSASTAQLRKNLIYF